MWKKFESLSAKKISILMATAVFLGVLFFFLPVILVSIHEVVSQGEARYSELEVIRAQKNLENEADQLDKTLKDWSAWDDTYRFAQDGNQAFIDDNLSDQALANLDIDAFIFVDLSNQVLYTKFVNRASQVEAPLPFKVETLLEAYPDLLVHPDVQSFKKGIAYLPNYPMLIASRPILNSYFEGPQQGTLILIRLLDAKRLDELSTVTLRKISLFPADALPEDLASVPTYPVLKDQVFSQARNSSIMTGYKYLADLSGQPALVLAVDNNRDLFLQGTITSIIFSAALLLLAGLLFGAAYHFSLSYQRSVQTGRKYLQRFQSIVEKSSEAILLVGSDCHILEANPVSKVLLAWPPETQEPICLRSLLKFEPDLDVNFIEEICASGAISEHHCTRHDGAVMDVELSASTIPDAEVQAFSLILRDITARKASEKALMASEERYELAAIGANDGLWDWDLVNGGIYYSTRWKAMLGYSDDEILPVAEEWFDRIHPHDLPLFQVQLTSHLQNRTANFEYEYRMRTKSGRYRWMLARGVAVWDPAGFANRIAGSQTDIHDRRITEERLRYDALHDSLTGLGNRLMLLDHLYTLNERKKRKPGLNFALFFMDFDRFKQVNDTLGHRAGDQVLIEAAKRLGVGLRGADIITHITSQGILARIAGDEFVVLLEDFKTVDEARAIAERVNRLVSQPYHVGDKLVTLTASMGMVVPDLAYENVEDIIRDADIAMYQAKQLGGAQVVQFDQEMYNGSVARMQLETDLRKAMENGEFEVYYQPIFNLHNDRIAGFEALIRWNHPQRGLLLPDEFIKTADEIGVIIPIGAFVLNKACRQMQVWLEKYELSSEVAISVNLSARQIMHPDIMETIQTVLRETRFNPKNLWLEVTESLLLANNESVLARINEMKALGCRFVVDDIGTGYSSLSLLQNFPVDAFKIDRSFIRDFEGGGHQIVKTLTELGSSLGLMTIAEGVETESQKEFLNGLSCHYAQGFLMSQTIPQQEIDALLQTIMDKRVEAVKN